MAIESIDFAKKPVPTGIEKDTNNTDFIWWGSDNMYPQFLVELFYESAYNNGIIESKVKHITSAGFTVNGTNEAKAQASVYYQNGTSDTTIAEVIKKQALDIEIFGGYALKIARRFDGSFAYIENMDFSSTRVSADKKQIFFSNNWATSNQSDETGFKQYPAFDPNDSDQLVSVLYYAQPSMAYGLQRSKPTFNVYPKPGYSGCIKDIMTDIEISSFHYYEICNGMKTGTMITFTNGEPPADEKSTLIQTYKDGMTNTENSGSVYLNFVKGQEEIPQIDTLSGNDLDKRYLVLSDDVRKKIMVGHSVVSPALFSVATPGAMGSNQELATGWGIFVKTYVRDKQTIIEDGHNFIQRAFGFSTKLEMNEPEMPFEMENAPTQVVLETKSNSVAPQIDASKNGMFSDTMLNAFTNVGGLKSDFKILASREIDFGTIENELEFSQSYNLDNFQLETAEIMILSMLQSGENITSIANALDLTEQQVIRIYTSLKNRGFIAANGNITETGIAEIKGNGTVVPEIRYSYDLRSDAPPLVAGGSSRDFCLAVMNMNRLWTRQEIDALTVLTPNKVSAWSYRGGWYHNPVENKNTLGCRHTWIQNIVTPLNN